MLLQYRIKGLLRLRMKKKKKLLWELFFARYCCSSYWTTKWILKFINILQKCKCQSNRCTKTVNRTFFFLWTVNRTLNTILGTARRSKVKIPPMINKGFFPLHFQSNLTLRNVIEITHKLFDWPGPLFVIIYICKECLNMMHRTFIFKKLCMLHWNLWYNTFITCHMIKHIFN